MKKLFCILMLIIATNATAARDGFKIGVEGSQFFTWYGGEAVYQVDDKKYNCKFDRIDRGVDNWGDAYKATGFYCTKDLYITVKEPQDNRKVLFIVINPAKFEERKAYYADMFIEYKKEEK